MREACGEIFFDYQTDCFIRSKRVNISKGCSETCRFCSKPEFYGREVRFTPIADLRKRFVCLWEDGVQHLDFPDDTFLLYVEPLIQVLEELAREGRKFAFSFSTPLTALFKQRQYLKTLKELGLRSVKLGLLNSNSDVLLRYCKGLTNEDQTCAMELVRNLGVQVQLQYILFDPLTTTQHLRNDLAFLERNRLIGFVPYTEILTSYLNLEAATPLERDFRLQQLYEPADNPYLPYHILDRKVEGILFWLLYFEWEFGTRWSHFHQLLLELRMELAQRYTNWIASDMGQELLHLTLNLRMIPYDLFKALLFCAEEQEEEPDIKESDMRRQCDATFGRVEAEYWKFRKLHNV